MPAFILPKILIFLLRRLTTDSMQLLKSFVSKEILHFEEFFCKILSAESE